MIGEIYHLSNDQIEYQITDRASFARFCGLKIGEKAPDANTFWLLKETLKETVKYEDLFQALLEALSNAGLEYSKCTIVDATFLDAPRNRNIKKEQREILKERSHNLDIEIPFELDLVQHESLESHLPEKERTMSHILRQTNIDAMWAKKGEEVDRKLKEKCPDVEHFTAKKGQKNKPLTQEQKDYNREIVSRVRARGERIFGFMTYCMGGLTIRFIGKPIKLILDNAKYQHCKIVMEYATKVGGELVFLPTYSPNLNLIARLWKFVKSEVLTAAYYGTFQDFQVAINDCVNQYR